MQVVIAILVLLLSVDYMDRNIEWEYVSKGDVISKRYSTLNECQFVQDKIGGKCYPKWRS